MPTQTIAPVRTWSTVLFDLDGTADQVRSGAMVWVGMGEVTVTSYGAIP